MENPIPYNSLFDIDGLNLATVELQAATDAYGNAATEDFKRIESVTKSLRKELEAISKTMQGGSIRLMDEAGQQQVQAYSRQISDLTTQYRNMQSQMEGLQRQITANNQALTEARIKESELRQELTQGRIATQAARTELAEYTLQTRQAAQANREAASAQTAATGSYKEAQNRLRDLGKTIREAEGGFEGNRSAIREQIVEYNALNQRLIAFDAQMGNHQRQVGNYAIANRGLSNSINQITRELPAFTFSIQTGLLGISNNLPILADEIGRTNEAIRTSTLVAQENAAAVGALARSQALAAGATEAAAVAEGELASATALANAQAQQQTIWKSLASGLFSWQTAMGVGILLLTLYGKEIVNFFKELFKGNNVIDSSVAKLKILNEVNKSANEDYAKQETTLRILYNTATDVNASMQDRINAVNELQKQWPETYKNMSDEVILSGQAKTATDLLTTSLYEQAKARAALSKIEKIAAQQLDADFQIQKINNARQNELSRAKPVFNVRGDLISTKEQEERIINDRANSSVKLQQQNKKILDDQINFLTDFAGGTTKIASIITKKDKEIVESQADSIAAIRKKISELQKLSDSSVKGSDTYNQIKELQARLKDLLGTATEAKEGFALLEEQLNKVSLQLQKAIINDYAKNQGKETENTKKLADAYVLLTDKINKLKEAQDAAQQAAQMRADFANRGNNPILSATGTSLSPSSEASGLSQALTHSVLIKELDDTQSFLTQINDAYAHTNDVIFQSYKDRKITLAQYNEQIQVSQDSAADDIFEQEKKAAELRQQLALDEYGKGSKEYRSSLKALGDLQAKYNQDSLRRDERLYAAKLKLQQETIAVLQKAASTIAQYTGNAGLGSLFGGISEDLINGIGDGEKFQKIADLGISAVSTYTDFAIEASNRRIDQLNKERDHDIGLAGNNAEAKAKIEEQYNQKIAAEKTKQAKLNRAAAAIDIIINTAVAVSKTIGQTGILGIGLAPIIAALGAVELGIVLSQPLPQYATGRNGGPAELAEVNERGPELIGQRGKWRLANRGIRGVTYLNKGDEVKTATDTKQMMANGMITADGQYVTNVSQSKAIYDQYIMASNKANDIDYHKMAGAVADGVSGLPVTEHSYNERGYQQNLRIKNTRMIDINRRNRF